MLRCVHRIEGSGGDQVVHSEVVEPPAARHLVAGNNVRLRHRLACTGGRWGGPAAAAWVAWLLAPGAGPVQPSPLLLAPAVKCSSPAGTRLAGQGIGPLGKQVGKHEGKAALQARASPATLRQETGCRGDCDKQSQAEGGHSSHVLSWQVSGLVRGGLGFELFRKRWHPPALLANGGVEKPSPSPGGRVLPAAQPIHSTQQHNLVWLAVCCILLHNHHLKHIARTRRSWQGAKPPWASTCALDFSAPSCCSSRCVPAHRNFNPDIVTPRAGRSCANLRSGRRPAAACCCARPRCCAAAHCIRCPLTARSTSCRRRPLQPPPPPYRPPPAHGLPSEEELRQLQEGLNYTFVDPWLLRQALVHPSFGEFNNARCAGPPQVFGSSQPGLSRRAETAGCS